MREEDRWMGVWVLEFHIPSEFIGAINHELTHTHRGEKNPHRRKEIKTANL